MITELTRERVPTPREICEDPALLKRYQKWKNDPVTRWVLLNLHREKDQVLSVALEKISPNSSFAILGQQAGATWAIQRMLSFDREARMPDEGTLRPDYGAMSDFAKEHNLSVEQLMKELGEDEPAS